MSEWICEELLLLSDGRFDFSKQRRLMEHLIKWKQTGGATNQPNI